jgi:hypothetical protein
MGFSSYWYLNKRIRLRLFEKRHEYTFFILLLLEYEGYFICIWLINIFIVLIIDNEENRSYF